MTCYRELHLRKLSLHMQAENLAEKYQKIKFSASILVAGISSNSYLLGKQGVL